MITSIRNYFKLITRILWSAAKAFVHNQDSLRASALTFYTLISVVPFLAVAFGIASGFGFDKYLEQELRQAFEEQGTAVGYAIQFAHSTLVNIRGSVIAGVGLVALLWTNLSLLGSIEDALNAIWNVKTPRSWSKKFTDYLAAMIICPIFFVVSSSLSVYLITRIAETAKEITYIEFLSSFIIFLLRLVPVVLSILLFIIIYLFIPNVQLRTKPRIIAGIIAGIAFQLWQWVYIRFQVDLSSYDAIYGTFAALPLFLIWLQVSWLIVLAGAELAAHIENEMVYQEPFEKNQQCEISQKELGILILGQTIQAFDKGEEPPTALHIAQSLGVMLMEAQEMIDILINSGILVEVVNRQGMAIGYHPSRDGRLFTLQGVRDQIDRYTGSRLAVNATPAVIEIKQSLQELDEIVQKSPANRTIEDLANVKPLYKV